MITYLSLISIGFIILLFSIILNSISLAIIGVLPFFIVITIAAGGYRQD
jgi:hypothetical protein